MKFTSQNLMPGQKLIPEMNNALAHTSVPTFIRESPPPPELGSYNQFLTLETQIIKEYVNFS